MDSGDWTEDIDHAHDFEIGPDAITFAMTHHLNNFEIIYAFPNPAYNLGTGRIDVTTKRALRS